MKFFYCFLFVCFPLFIFSQKKISADYDHQPLSTVLKDLEKNHQIVFSYPIEIIDNQTVTTSFKDQPLEKGLFDIFKTTAVDFEIVNETYIILKKRSAQNNEIFICGKVVDEQQSSLPFSKSLDFLNSLFS